MNQFDDPNREAVGLEPAWVEGAGGEPGAAASEAEPQAAGGGQYAAEYNKALDDMTKAELLEVAEQRGVNVDATWTKADIREAIGD